MCAITFVSSISMVYSHVRAHFFALAVPIVDQPTNQQPNKQTHDNDMVWYGML